MIIQCKQCRTKFRFNEAQMEGDGLWMRCSKCQHVFFQDHPLKVKPVVLTQEDYSSEPLQAVEPPRAVRRPSFEPAEKDPGAVKPDDDVKNFLNEVMTPEKAVEHRGLAVAPPVDQTTSQGVPDMDYSTDAENALGGDEMEGADEGDVPLPRKKSRAWKVALWSILVIVVIPAVAYFILFPDLGSRYLRIAEKYAGVSLSQPTEGQDVAGQVKLQDIRQRMVNNFILGNIRVVEGTVVNQADFPVSRIRVKGEILDAYAVVLGERVTYAGNILSDEELTNMPEEFILKRLSLPEGRDNSNENIIPNGRLPFMIVFTRDQPAAIKTTVMVAGAERLL